MQDTDFGKQLRLYSQHSFQALLCTHFGNKENLDALRKHLLASAMQGKYDCSYEFCLTMPLHNITLQTLEDENLFEQAVHYLVVDLLRSQPTSLTMTNGGYVESTVTLHFSWMGKVENSDVNIQQDSVCHVTPTPLPGSSRPQDSVRHVTPTPLPGSSRRIQQPQDLETTPSLFHMVEQSKQNLGLRAKKEPAVVLPNLRQNAQTTAYF